MLRPTTHNVAQIVVEEMMKWSPIANEAARRKELYAMADRLILYFDIFRAQPVQLDGLPGGHAIGTPRK